MQMGKPLANPAMWQASLRQLNADITRARPWPFLPMHRGGQAPAPLHSAYLELLAARCFPTNPSPAMPQRRI